jgi:hypothetical protein
MISFSLHMVGKNDPACLVLPSALSASDAAHLCRLISQMADIYPPGSDGCDEWFRCDETPIPEAPEEQA